eukprot:GHVQ01003875.1.p1 GENE.GHVQ01003875.1~~GHVQ01003875.1.p1  ORF type:complete len:269 (-),score=36.89 GHVQ01003875.1:162-968(-)
MVLRLSSSYILPATFNYFQKPTTITTTPTRFTWLINLIVIIPTTMASPAPVYPNVTYFDIKGIAEPTRLGLFIAGADFEDTRIKSFDEFKATIKPTLPFGQLPIIELSAGDVTCQSIAMLTYAGEKAGLFPAMDSLKATNILECVSAVEELRMKLAVTVHMEEENKKKTREELGTEILPRILEKLEALVKKKGGNGFMVGDTLTIADLHAYCHLSWMNSGLLDHLPTTLLDACPELSKVVRQTQIHPKVLEWNARTRRGSTVSQKSDV